jgi:hypothetical protein
LPARTLSLLNSVYSQLSTLLVGPSMAFSFEKLLVYQKAVDFADAICEKTEHFTRGYERLAGPPTIPGPRKLTGRDRSHLQGQVAASPCNSDLAA